MPQSFRVYQSLISRRWYCLIPLLISRLLFVHQSDYPPSIHPYMHLAVSIDLSVGLHADYIYMHELYIGCWLSRVRR